MGSCRRTTNSQPLSILLSASLPSRSALVLTVIRKSFGFRIEFWRSTGESDGIDKTGMALQGSRIEENQEEGDIAKGWTTSEDTHKEISPFVQDQPSRR